MIASIFKGKLIFLKNKSKYQVHTENCMKNNTPQNTECSFDQKLKTSV